jgi:alanine racemase
MSLSQADGYGHGAEQVGKTSLEAGAHRLAVAVVEEGT